MKKLILTSAVIVALAGCSEDKVAQQPSPEVATQQGSNSAISEPELEVNSELNHDFNEFSAQFIEDFWLNNPGYAVYMGYYKYDDQLFAPTAERLATELAFAKDSLRKLNGFDVSQLSANNASDFYILKNQLESQIFSIEELKSYEWNPSNYNVAGVFGVILNTNYKDVDERLRTIFKRMQNIPAYYEAAMNNIKTPTIAHTELAISQNKGALALFNKQVKAAATGSGLTEQEKTAFASRLRETERAITGYIEWLEDKLAFFQEHGSAKDFRIGETLYEKKFALDIFSSLTAKQLYEKALQEKTRVHGELILIADKLWPKYFADKAMPDDKLVAVKQLIDHISVKHVSREQFVDSIRAQIPTLEKFVIDNNLLEMDADKPLVVRQTPEYQQGFAVASINPPGPYDAKANTYYNVTPLDKYTPDQAESFLREYNHWLLQILNIHEAVPGHYTQLVHSNKSKSLVKSIFGNGAMVEGWAVYTERMMLEEGYGDFEPELWLMYYKWNLRVIMNAIIDYSIQVKNMSQEEAIDLMINEAFQEQAEADGKWRRATLSQVQLTSYFTGYSEIYDLREDVKANMGDDFNLTDFHNQFLSYGSAPVPIIRKMMLADDK